VAATFGKEHGDVLRDIRDLNCSNDFSQTNFRFAVFLDEQEKQRPRYEMTRDGSTASSSCPSLALAEIGRLGRLHFVNCWQKSNARCAASTLRTEYW
jgi:hypothetical protein